MRADGRLPSLLNPISALRSVEWSVGCSFEPLQDRVDGGARGGAVGQRGPADQQRQLLLPVGRIVGRLPQVGDRVGPDGEVDRAADDLVPLLERAQGGLAGRRVAGQRVRPQDRQGIADDLARGSSGRGPRRSLTMMSSRS